jgi:hypothetical protein
VETWFQNHRPHKKRTEAKTRTVDHRIAGTWNVRKVVQHTMKEEIAKHAAAKDATALPGTSAYIIAYQKNCSEVVKNLTSAQLVNCQQQAVEWNSAGPDATAQALWVHIFNPVTAYSHHLSQVLLMKNLGLRLSNL